MKQIVTVLMALTIGSCHSPGSYFGKDTIDIRVENQTGSELTTVKVFVTQEIKVNGTYQITRTDSSLIGTIANTKTAMGTLYEKNIQGVDGSYLMTATGQNGEQYTHRFGYLTNGAFLDSEQHLIVQKDSIILRR